LAEPGLDLPLVHHADHAATASASTTRRACDAMLAAQVLTRVRPVAPVRTPSTGAVARNTHAGAQRLAREMGVASLAGVTLVATVPPQHCTASSRRC